MHLIFIKRTTKDAKKDMVQVISAFFTENLYYDRLSSEVDKTGKDDK